MGIWDAISWTTESLKHNTPDLTAAKAWCPSTDSITRIVPDGTAVKKVCSAAYGYGSSAVTKVDGAVRGNMVTYVRDEVGWYKIAQVGTIVAKHATHEALKLIPGGSAVYNVGSRSIRDLNNSNKQEPDVKALQAKLLRLEKEFSEYKELSKPSAAELIEKKNSPSEVTNIHSNVGQKAEDTESAYGSNILSVGTHKPEDEIRVFMMKGFVFRQFLDDMIVPVPRKEDNGKCKRG